MAHREEWACRINSMVVVKGCKLDLVKTINRTIEAEVADRLAEESQIWVKEVASKDRIKMLLRAWEANHSMSNNQTRLCQILL